MEECQKASFVWCLPSFPSYSPQVFIQGTINARINILYLLDSLCDASLLSKANSASSTNTHGNLYTDYVSRDLGTIVEYVVPEDREGLINLMSAVQVCPYGLKYVYSVLTCYALDSGKLEKQAHHRSTYCWRGHH